MPKYKQTDRLIEFFYWISLFLLIQAVILDIHNVKTYGQIDLRNRIVGTRMAILHKDPYFYKFDIENDPIELLDPVDWPEIPVTRVTIPPSNFFIFYPFKDLTYKQIQTIWFLLEWIFAFVIMKIFLSSVTGKHQKKIIKIVAFLFLSIFVFWHNHIEKGQTYIFYTLILSFVYYFYTKVKSSFLAGIISGVGIVFRPFFIFLNIPFFIKGDWKFILGNILGAITFFLVTIITFGLNLWKSFFKSIDFQSKMNIDFSSFDTVEQYFQKIADSYVYKLTLSYYISSDSSIQGFFHNFLDINLSPFTLKIALLIFISVCSIIIFVFRKNFKNPDTIFLIGVLLVAFSEYFVPAARFNYSNIIYLIPLLIITKNYKKYFSNLSKVLYKFEGKK